MDEAAYTPVTARAPTRGSSAFPSSFRVKTDKSPAGAGPSQDSEDAEQFAEISQKREIEARQRIQQELRIITLLSEGAVTVSALKDALPVLSVALYQDVLVERQVNSVCAYPICGNAVVSHPIDQPLYKMVQNKIYDYKERSSFCSKACHHRSKWVERVCLGPAQDTRLLEEVEAEDAAASLPLAPPAQPSAQGIEPPLLASLSIIEKTSDQAAAPPDATQKDFEAPSQAQPSQFLLQRQAQKAASLPAAPSHSISTAAPAEGESIPVAYPEEVPVVKGNEVEEDYEEESMRDIMLMALGLRQELRDSGEME